jgi:hypothetical protein
MSFIIIGGSNNLVKNLTMFKIKNKKKQKGTEKLVLASESSMIPKSKEIDDPEFDEFNEKIFKKLMKDKNNMEFKEDMKHIDMLNPDDFGQMRDLAKLIKKVLLILYIKICLLKSERDEAQSKLRAYQEGSKS